MERIFNGSAAPLTSLAICPLTKTLYTGSWDKTIYCIPLGKPSEVRKLVGHSDFIKTLLAASLAGKPILISGSADANIIVWDPATGKQLHKLKGHSKALQHLTIDPESLQADSFTLFSASSDREIRRWHISLESAHELSESLSDPIRPHETSIYALHWDSDGSGLWTASADFTAKYLVRDRNWEADAVLQHPDFVRDVLPFEDLGLVVTACRDEEVRVWEIASGKCVCTYSGHYEEVTALVPAVGERGVVSVGIDGTVRQWSLDRGEMAKFVEEREQEMNGVVKDSSEEKKKGMLTAEEEAELAELMDDED